MLLHITLQILNTCLEHISDQYNWLLAIKRVNQTTLDVQKVIEFGMMEDISLTLNEM